MKCLVTYSAVLGHTLDKATKAKLTLEYYYANLISQHKERHDRRRRLEDSLKVTKIFED